MLALRLPLTRLISTRLLSTEIRDRLQTLTTASDVVVFMKGVPAQPMCGFSNAVVQILSMHGVQYSSHNVLDDNDIREGIKEFSSWPTIPQVYFKGEFVGGCDVLLSQHQSGELVEELEKIGVRSKLLDEQTPQENEKK